MNREIHRMPGCEGDNTHCYWIKKNVARRLYTSYYPHVKWSDSINARIINYPHPSTSEPRYKLVFFRKGKKEDMIDSSFELSASEYEKICAEEDAENPRLHGMSGKVRIYVRQILKRLFGK